MFTTIGQPVPELPVADVERAQRYYRDVLGFEIGWLDPTKEIGAVSRGNVAIFFRKRRGPFEPAVHWVFAENVDATYEELRSSGSKIMEALEQKPWGLRQFTVEDLDGNRFYFHGDREPCGWTILAIFLLTGFGASASGPGFRRYSIVTLVIAFVSFALTGIEAPRLAANQPHPGWASPNVSESTHS